MASSGIGGQAVMEGVMMKHKDRYAVAVRKPDKEIIVESKDYRSICKSEKLRKLPVFRGVVNFIDSLVVGMGTLTFSASFFEEDEKEAQQRSEKKEKAVMGVTVCLSILLAIGIFMVLPFFISFC